MLQDILTQFETTGGVPYVGAFNPFLVLLSIAVAIMAAFVALSLASRIAAATTVWASWAWIGAGAFAMGGGIWSMHFIGMLAFSLPCGESYNPLGTLLSMIPGVLASGVALRLIGQTSEPGLLRLSGGAVLMGAGIGAMHYSGMASMELQALLRYEPYLVAVSIVVAVALAFVSLAIRFYIRRYRVSDTLAIMVAAPVMGLAVAGMHYTAMKAAVFLPISDILPIGLRLPSTLMALMIAIIALLITAIALAGSVAGRQSELAAGLRVEVERRQAAEQAAESGRARLQAIFDAVNDAIVTIDRNGHIQQWSSGAQRIFGYAPEEVIGKNPSILMPESYRARPAGDIDCFLKIIDIGRELVAIRKDGSEFPIELTVSEVRNGGEVFFTGILRDITERKRAADELVRARDEAQAANLAKSQFLATMSHEIRTPMNGVIGMANLLSTTSLNDRQRRLVGNVSRSGQALLGIINDILDFAKIESGKFEFSSVPFEPRETIAEMSELFTERCGQKGLEFIYSVAEDVPGILVGDPMRLRQILVNLVGNSVKFTERGEILVEVSLAKCDAQGVVLNFAVEDTGIGISAEQHERIFESFHQVDGSLTRARGGSGLGLAITRQLVELMGGQIRVESEPGRGSRFSFTTRFQPSSLAGEAARAPRHLAHPMRVLLADSNPVSAQVISRYLASWQIDATIVIALDEAKAAWDEAAAAGRPFDAAILDIKGLPPETLDFAAEIRAGAGDKRGELILLTGLDTYMSDSSLDQLDAAAVLPKPARPSELFSALASISHGREDAKLTRYTKRLGLHAGLPNFGARILVAEDNPVNQDVASGMLELMGCRTVSAPNGRAAFHLFAQQRFDAILMDCEMPIMDGIEATRRIRELEATAQGLPEGAKKHIPIIASTAHALAEVREKCYAAGMDDFLTKPFDERQMAETLLRWLTPAGGELETGADDEEDAEQANEATVPAKDEVIDGTVIEGLRAMARPGRPSPLGRALARFLESTPPIVATIHDTCDKGDAGALWRAAHSLKSSAGALGAKQLSQRCAEIEARARDSGIDAARPLVDFIDDDLAAAIDGLKARAGGILEPAA
ncbi:MAG TPA: MHYT domain-containing protein [Stellaceae bacterium]|nr:MHYT domain-containing protein [Stellaceae bacterium]